MIVKQDKIYSNPLCIAEIVTSVRVDTQGYAQIRNDGPLMTFTGATVPGFAIRKGYAEISSTPTTFIGAAVPAFSVPQIGYAEISNAGIAGPFVGVTVPAIPTATYDIDITMDGGTLHQLAIAIVNTDDWTTIVAAIQVALRTATGALETVLISGGRIRVTSVTAGATSTALIAAGTLGSGGGDLLAAIDLIVGYTTHLETPVTGAQASTYDLDITIDGGALRQLAVVFTTADDWDTVCGKIQIALRALTSALETVAVVSGRIRVTSATNSASSSVLIAAGTAGSLGGNVLAAIDAVMGYTPTLETPVTGAQAATYDLDVTVDGTIRKLGIALATADDWTGICSKIQSTLRTATGSTETVAILSGKIRITSATDGGSSTILIAAGTLGSVGGDILAAIDAVTGYQPALETPVAGAEGAFAIQVSPDAPTTKDFLFHAGCLDSAGHAKALTYSFSKTTGKVTVTDGPVHEMAVGDHVVLSGILI